MHLRLRNPSSDANFVACLRTAQAEGAAVLRTRHCPQGWSRSLRRKVRRLRYHRLTVKHRTITRQFNLRNCENTNALVNKQARREVRSGEGATLACDGFAVPPTGRVQQHEQMEAARRSRILGSPGRS